MKNFSQVCKHTSYLVAIWGPALINNALIIFTMIDYTNNLSCLFIFTVMLKKDHYLLVNMAGNYIFR